MSLRRTGREAALQYLYQLDLTTREPNAPPSEFWELRQNTDDKAAPDRVRIHAEQLVHGIANSLEQIDGEIKKWAANYELHRIAAVDRNILRIAIYEMLFCPDIPPVVSINEAIEIAKKYGSEESGRFVNGILDRVRGELKRSARQAGQKPDEPTA